MIWKLLMGIIVEKLYRHLERNGLLVNDEQKGCRKGSRGTKDQLLVDKTVVKNCRRELTNLSMAWIDDMVPPFVDAEMPGDGCHVAHDPRGAKEAGYRLAKDMRPINHLLFMDDLELYGAIKDQLDSLIQVVRIFSEDIKMSFGLESALSWKLEKGRVDSSGIDLTEDQHIGEVEEGAYRYHGILQLDQT
ncbi:unnamed protein product, partial [Porites evermanni]